MLAVLLLAEPPALPRQCGSAFAHAVANFAVATASTLFHGAVMAASALGGGRVAPLIDQITAAFLGFDLLAANIYGASLAYLMGFVRPLLLFAPPLLLLVSSAYVKRQGSPKLYALLHGTWHLLSAAAIYRLLYFDQNGLSLGLAQ